MNDKSFSVAITNGSRDVIHFIHGFYIFFFLDVKNKLDDLHKVVKSFQDRAGITEELEKMDVSVSTP